MQSMLYYECHMVTNMDRSSYDILVDKILQIMYRKEITKVALAKH